jgi:hypothetical protein
MLPFLKVCYFVAKIAFGLEHSAYPKIMPKGSNSKAKEHNTKVKLYFMEKVVLKEELQEA